MYTVKYSSNYMVLSNRTLNMYKIICDKVVRLIIADEIFIYSPSSQNATNGFDGK